MARKKSSDQLTRLELELMKILWESGPATVQIVQHRLSQTRELAYTTVQTMLNLLHSKGKVKRTLKDRAYYYRPAITRQQVVRQSMRDIIDRLFGGSTESLVMSLVETRDLTPKTLAKLNKLLNQSREIDHGDD